MKVTNTPTMKAYKELKQRHPDAILLFRIGDFYEAFSEDAVIASEILGITLTRRRGGKEPIELAGFPHHALDTYLPRLVRAGKRVAICEQLDDIEQQKKEEILPPDHTKRENGLIIGKKEQLDVRGVDDSDGRFMIHKDRVGIFISEGHNKWYFAPLYLTPEEEERYRLYTELSCSVADWIWVDEYGTDSEKITHYEDTLALYHKFVRKYGYLNSPRNAEFIRKDDWGEQNLRQIERKVTTENGVEGYEPGFDFGLMRASVEKIKEKARLASDFSAFLAYLSEVVNKLYIFGEIRDKTREIRSLSAKLNLSPKKLFEECSKIECLTINFD